ncbi:MAG: BspA family leucine-rich repeat surface protein [Bacteroidales bacterium]
MLLQKKWMLSLAFLFVGWCAMAQTPTLPAGAGTSGDPYQIATLDNLYWVTQNSWTWANGTYFKQTADIDATSTSTWEAGAGLSPIGNDGTKFKGSYDGNGHVISNLTINRPTVFYVGLFGRAENGGSSKIENLGVVNANVTGQGIVGVLVGYNMLPVSKCYSTGAAHAEYYTGGLVGLSYGAIDNCYSKVATNALVTFGYAGGLVASNGSSISNCYSTGAVIAAYSGGLVADNTGTVESSYWDKETSGKATSAGGNGKTTAEMKTQSTFTGWDFTTIPIWVIDGTNNAGYPYLKGPIVPPPPQPMQLVFNFPSASQHIYLPLRGTVNCTVDWGDGSAPEHFTYAGEHYHLYAAAGIHTVSISGLVTQFGANSNTYPLTYLTEVTSFGTLGLTSLIWAFTGANSLTSVPAELPATVTILHGLFDNSTVTAVTNLNLWDVSHVTNMMSMFYNAVNFNQDIGNWNTSSVLYMNGTFFNSAAFNQNISTWDVHSVTNMGSMFYGAASFNKPLNAWQVGSVTTMEYMFRYAAAFNQDISDWDVSSVTNMSQMFWEATTFNQDISRWNVGKVVSIYNMFYGATTFNQDIGDWDVSKVTSFAGMFYDARAFNQDISAWDVSSATSMQTMFSKATAFNQAIGSWNVSNVTNFQEMFWDATSFNQNLASWNISNATNLGGMFSWPNALSTVYYDAMLIAWDGLSVNSNLNFSAGKSKYTSGGAAEAARQHLISSDNWNISDGGTDQSFVWDGSESSDWNTAGNWNLNRVPYAALNDDVIIANAGVAPVLPDVNEGVAGCHNITVNPGASFTINSGGSFISTGTITNLGTINIKRDITESKWHLVSIPTVTANANVFLGDYLQGYSESTALWSEIIPAITPLAPVHGYALWPTYTPGKISVFSYTFTGTPNTGDLRLPVTAEKQYGWNLVGNPYPSGIDWNAVIASQTDLNAAIYYYNGTTYMSYIPGFGGGGSRYVLPMQGFFVSAKNNGYLYLDNTHRQHASGPYFKEKEIPDHCLRLTTTGNSITDELHIRFNESATPDFDGQYDAWKLLSWNEQAPQLYSFSGSEILSIDQRPTCEMIQLGFFAATAGVYSIAVNEMTDFSSATLEDTKTNSFHDLSKGQYEFVWEITDNEKRFKLHLNSVGIEETPISESNILIYAANNQIFIKGAESGEVMVSDVMGRMIVKEEIAGSGMITVPVKLETGIYLVTVKSNGEVKTEKVFIR